MVRINADWCLSINLTSINTRIWQGALAIRPTKTYCRFQWHILTHAKNFQLKNQGWKLQLKFGFPFGKPASVFGFPVGNPAPRIGFLSPFLGVPDTRKSSNSEPWKFFEALRTKRSVWNWRIISQVLQKERKRKRGSDDEGNSESEGEQEDETTEQTEKPPR